MKKGFSLVELLLVVAILATMATFVVVKLTGAQAAARDSRRQSDVRQYQNAIEIYSNSNGGIYPIPSPLTTNAISLCGSGNALGAIPCADDPVTSQHYQYSTNASGTSYVIWAILEKPNPDVAYYLCSNGTAAQHALPFSPTNGVCP